MLDICDGFQCDRTAKIHIMSLKKVIWNDGSGGGKMTEARNLAIRAILLEGKSGHPKQYKQGLCRSVTN